MTIAFSIKRIRSSSGTLREDVANDTKSSSPCKLNFLKSNPSEHQRRSSLSAIFQYCFRASTNEQHKHSSAFENDALFERYRYRQQQKRAPPPHLLPTSAANDNRTHHHNNNDDDDEPPLRVICRPEQTRATSILINKHHHGHRHTSSLQTTAAPPMVNHQHHRRSKTATHIRHFSASNITTHSEDLTAKEFADIAGIKILPDDVDPAEYPQQQQQQQQHPASPYIHPTVPVNDTALDDLSSSHIMASRSSSRHQQHPSAITTMTVTTATTTYSSGVNTPLARESSPSSSSSSSPGDERQPHIWDDAFWRNPDRGGTGGAGYFQPRQQKEEPQSSTEENSDDNLPPVLLEMRYRNSVVIKRGRFEVHLQQASSSS